VFSLPRTVPPGLESLATTGLRNLIVFSSELLTHSCRLHVRAPTKLVFVLRRKDGNPLICPEVSFGCASHFPLISAAVLLWERLLAPGLRGQLNRQEISQQPGFDFLSLPAMGRARGNAPPVSGGELISRGGAEETRRLPPSFHAWAGFSKMFRKQGLRSTRGPQLSVAAVFSGGRPTPLFAGYNQQRFSPTSDSGASRQDISLPRPNGSCAPVCGRNAKRTPWKRRLIQPEERWWGNLKTVYFRLGLHSANPRCFCRKR